MLAKSFSLTTCLSIILLFFFPFYTNAQNGQPLVINGSVANGFNLGAVTNGGNAMAYDKHGNVYYTGYFTGTVDFDPGVGVTSRTNSYNSGGVIFLAKYDINGNLLWINTFGSDKSSNTYTDVGTGVKTDANDNVYMIANIYGTVDFDPSSGVANAVANVGSTDAVLAKYNSSGTFQWVMDIGGPNTNSDLVTGLDIDNNNNVYIAGQYSPVPGVGITDGTGAVTNLATSGSAIDFLLKVAPSNGTVAWAKYAVPTVGGASSLVQCAVNNSTGDLYVTGTCTNGTVFNPGDAAPVTASLSATGGFIWKLNSSGQNTYVKFFGGLSGFIALDANGDPVLAGFFNGSGKDLDPSASNQILKTSAGSNDGYVARLNASDGSAAWVLTVSGTGNDQCVRVVTSGTDIYVGVNYASSPTTFPLGASTTTFSSLGGSDAAIMKISTAGVVQWVNPIASTGTDAIRGLAFYNGMLRIGAVIGATADLDPSSTGTLSATATVASLASVTWTPAGTLGTATSLPVTLLSYNAAALPNKTVTINWETAQEENSSYFIVEKSNDNTHYSELAKVPAQGTSAIPSSYAYVDENPSQGNNYYRLSEYDLDGKPTIFGIKLINLTAGPSSYKVVPNPAAGSNVVLTLNTEPDADLTYKLLDLNGITVKSGRVSSRNQVIDIGGLAAGVYIIRLSNGNVLRFQRQ